MLRGSECEGLPYKWEQTLGGITVYIDVPLNTRWKMIDCKFDKKHIVFGIKGHAPIIDADLFDHISPAKCEGMIEDRKLGHLEIIKKKAEWWPQCFIGTGEGTIDTKTIEPPESQISDLAPSTQSLVQKMLFDQRQKALGRPTSDDIKKQQIVEKFMKEHPEMDFSETKIL
ncbi:NudC family like protein [Aduncisulcus paluster]|uniref:NudC family like protein n=1 Tax=Aduncisulcus paluster TaxID=2918883 RepID=A0ABQ5KX53_9EUKA|nr:NudC family like protein [Aduncisulcus paluster]